MSPHDFSKLLKQRNPHAHSLGYTVRWLADNRTMVLMRKDKRLLENLQQMLAGGLYPLVDKRLGMIFGLGESSHTMMKCDLFRYHNTAGKTEVEDVGACEAADRWLYEGMGFYFSSIAGRDVIVASTYTNDVYDPDVFLTFRKRSRV